MTATATASGRISGVNRGATNGAKMLEDRIKSSGAVAIVVELLNHGWFVFFFYSDEDLNDLWVITEIIGLCFRSGTSGNNKWKSNSGNRRGKQYNKSRKPAYKKQSKGAGQAAGNSDAWLCKMPDKKSSVKKEKP